MVSPIATSLVPISLKTIPILLPFFVSTVVELMIFVNIPKIIMPFTTTCRGSPFTPTIQAKSSDLTYPDSITPTTVVPGFVSSNTSLIFILNRASI